METQTIQHPAPQYQIHLPQFEGPFDLLLFFIERDELDVRDIHISKITKDFLDYIHTLESLNLEVASEFILVAATLMKIKAKMLLPRPIIKEDGSIEDPRTELINRLLEYKRYKAVLEEIEVLEMDADKYLRRGFSKTEEQLIAESTSGEEELVGLDLYSIMKTFRRIWLKHKTELETPRHVIKKYPFSMDELKDRLFQRLSENRRVDFASYVLEVPEKIYAVFGFLAILELTAARKINIIVGEGFNNFWVEQNESLAA